MLGSMNLTGCAASRMMIRYGDLDTPTEMSERFLMARLVGLLGSSGDDVRYILVENWFEELRQRMGN
jgi:hypothetical protein